MTETIKYLSQRSPLHVETQGLFVRLARVRRYGLLSKVALLGRVLFNVQSNLSTGSSARVLRRSR